MPMNSSAALQVVMLGLGDEIFALDASLVREIIDPIPATRVAGAPAYLARIVNVRGNVIPLADLRVRFGMAQRENTADTRIIVLEIALDGEPVTVGIIADKVYEVTELSCANAQPTPRVGMRVRPEFVRFIAKWNEEFVTVPDLERILN
ncbi:chemotaxis protein CheW [Methylocapsa acidiphila]|uniref:chemotaxis protein CheW n=1 Tax=Methylocapsa acidiphila TaxID=133552 RepID=UPI0004237AAE|nr:chemotaxis protein CheW [Methylocapsa acidiphila]